MGGSSLFGSRSGAAIALIFVLPILPDEVICVGAGVAGINTYKFISVAAVSKIITSVSLSYSLQLIKFNVGICMIIVLLVLIIFAVNKLKKL